MIRRAALSKGLIDPFAVLSRLKQFAQPSDIKESIEFLREGLVFHARGLINTQAIQHNLDWIWPYWVHEQFNPLGGAFVPRAFSITHVNLTHRNWTAVGVPDHPVLPLVDPRGLITPFFDAWSVDGWIIDDSGNGLFPSSAREASQQLLMDDNSLTIRTTASANGMTLMMEARAEMETEAAFCRVSFCATAKTPAWLAVSLRPYNPEGVSIIKTIRLRDDDRGWSVNGSPCAAFREAAERHYVSNYRDGDVRFLLPGNDRGRAVECPVGMATAAALWRLQPNTSRTIDMRVRMDDDPTAHTRYRPPAPVPRLGRTWHEALSGTAKMQAPDERFMFLYDSALRTLVLHSPHEVYPGPYTYKRFWYRDAAFIIDAMLVSGLVARSERALDLFPLRQKMNGFFHSQAGEWDSNGEVLWILKRFCDLTGMRPKEEWRSPIIRGAQWIMRKRLSDAGDEPHAGLLPAGFSAEHLGPNDYYYWDDFWAVAGLRAAASMMSSYDDKRRAALFDDEAVRFMSVLERSFERDSKRLGRPALPASPYRRLDAGAIGSIVAAHPLLLLPPRDERLLDTADFLLNNCWVRGGFFQEMIHSGINAYLTLHVAQLLLRAEDPRFFDLIRTIADLATATGQWPEAIHPGTLGGCMGDGQHVWAAAEWVLMVRNLFVREEHNELILASGIPPQWLDSMKAMSFGPTPTPWGCLQVWVEPREDSVTVKWQANWRTAPAVKVVLAGLGSRVVEPGKSNEVRISRSRRSES